MDGGDGALEFRPGNNVLDPSAQEFHPSPYHLTLPPPQIYYPYTPPPPPPLPMHLLPPPPPPPPPPLPSPQTAVRTRPAYVSHGPAEALPDAVPTRSLLLSSVPANASEGLVRMELESFGGVRAVEMSRLAAEGIVTVHFYDLHAARAAMDAVRGQHVRHQGRAWQQLHCEGQFGAAPPPPWELPPLGVGMVAGRPVWAQFAPEPPAPNNGSLVVFNLDPSVSSSSLKEVFQAFGAVKETRETPMKPRHRFVEFFDTRDAARALVELNGKELFGRKVVIEFSRPGGHGRSNYSRKSSSHQPAGGGGAAAATAQLPPRLAVAPTLPRTSSNISSSSSQEGGGGAADGDECSAPTRREGEGCKRRGGGNKGPSKHQQQQVSSSTRQGRSFKNLQRSRSSSSRAAMEARFLIREDPSAAAAEEHEGGGSSSSSPSPASARDPRTTVMIKNIPNKYSQKLLLNMLDNHCMHCNEQIVANGDQDREPFSSYDFVYLPIDFNNKCNVGYGFVNMTSPEATWRLYKAFHLQPWVVFNSRKICQITYARLQGLEALLDHFRNSKFACDNDEYMPVFFSPPRDGKNLTEPTTVGGRAASASSSSSSAPLTKMVLLRVTSSSDQRGDDGGGSSSTSPGSTPLHTVRCGDDGDGEEEEEEEEDDEESNEE